MIMNFPLRVSYFLFSLSSSFFCKTKEDEEKKKKEVISKLRNSTATQISFKSSLLALAVLTCTYKYVQAASLSLPDYEREAIFWQGSSQW